jgi:hypothetical protein
MYCKQKVASFELLSRICGVFVAFSQGVMDGRRVNLRTFKNSVMLVSLVTTTGFNFVVALFKANCAADVSL